MTHFTRLIPVAGVLLAALALIPDESIGFTTLGGSLGINQRDFRVYNNFTDATANDNVTPDPRFPGFVGAPLAIWKACIEWGSEPHADGGGDPHQSILGSGGSNFDPSFQGLTNQVGGQNANIHSAISGNDGSTLAFMEGSFGGVSDGWRIRYFEGWEWDDGPGTNISGFDLQGVAAHEYGHALGLGHSSANNATMRGSIIQDGVPDRSIAQDDIDGIQSIYSTVASDKPRITDIQYLGAYIEITGTNFTPENNQVWFTNGGLTGDGTPVMVTGVDSLESGTRLQVFVPSDAGSGDVLVRKNATGFTSLSNTYPFDSSLVTQSGGINYCVATPNSSFASGAIMAVSGSNSISANQFTIEVSSAKPDSFGIFFYGPNQVSVPTADGIRCIGGGTLGLTRLGSQATNSAGFAERLIDFTDPLTPLSTIAVGSLRHFQFFYRDTDGGPAGFNFSDAITVIFLP